jgi:hypothetical protein
LNELNFETFTDQVTLSNSDEEDRELLLPKGDVEFKQFSSEFCLSYIGNYEA